MASATEFRLLGPVEVRRAGLVIPVQPGKQRTVLAALLLKGDRVVPLEELGEVLWGPARPPSERATLRNYIKRSGEHSGMRAATGSGLSRTDT